MYDLKEDFNWYLQHQDELIKEYLGKTLVIREKNVVGSFDSQEEAYEYGMSNYGLGNFLIQECTAGSQSYTQTFYTRRVIFS